MDTVEECIDGYAVQVLGYEVVDTRELYERYNIGQADEATVKILHLLSVKGSYL